MQSQAAQKDTEGKEKETVVEELNLKEDKEEGSGLTEPEGEDAEKTKDADVSENVKEDADNAESTPNTADLDKKVEVNANAMAEANKQQEE